MTWGQPEMLYLLWGLIPLCWLLLWQSRRTARRMRSFFGAKNLSTVLPDWNPRRARFRILCWMGAMALSLMALARPQWGYSLEEVTREGMDILVVLDTSNSMLARDIKPNRLQQAKWGIQDLLPNLTGDRIGLVAFAGSSFLQCPLTSDYAAFEMTLDDIYAGIIPRGGTAITQALGNAMRNFEYERDADRAILLITDGEDHEGDPTSLIKELKEKNIRVYALGVGTLDGEFIQTADASGREDFIRDRKGTPIKSRLNEEALEKIAVETGGVYIRTVPGDFGLERIYHQGLASLKRSEEAARTERVYHERFMWALVPAGMLLLLEAATRTRTRKKRSRPS